jgi:hypothetical protein
MRALTRTNAAVVSRAESAGSAISPARMINATPNPEGTPE